MKPNILFVLTDQQTMGAIGCLGGWMKTPAMDSLVRDGMRFQTSWCVSPVCGPSRASLATGRLPFQHGLVYNHDGRFRDAEADRLPTFADGLREGGYRPYWIGKWHAEEFYPNRNEQIHGFDFLATDAEGFCGLGLDMDAAVTDRALRFFNEASCDPWFLGVSWHNPHDICYWIMGEYLDRLREITDAGELPPLPENFSIPRDEAEFLQICRERKSYGMEMMWTKEWDETAWRRYLRAYGRLVEHIDAELGRLLAGLRAAGHEENTLVVFTSDHGEGCAARQWVVKLSPAAEVLSVPLLARWPGVIEPGSVCGSHLASGLDLAPTFLDLAGQPADLPGRSLLPFFATPWAEGRDEVVACLEPDPSRPELSARALRTASASYHRFSTGEPREVLYDLLADPGETTNIANRSPELLADLRGRLDRWIIKNSDPFPAQRGTPSGR